ncbi:hypothetical protein B0H10DRAFT_2218239 [Mycena sp. CBHHK59/15]|nr:hypothetical protein B0H10DRAFT_2218239 [Mycena sp. CBHHK59/15]
MAESFPGSDLDLTKGLFEFFSGGDLSIGALSASWSYINGNGRPQPPPTSTGVETFRLCSESRAMVYSSSNLSRRNSSLIVQLRTGMVGLNSWLHKIHRADSPLCPTCHRREDVAHFIFFCSRFSHHRSIFAPLGCKSTSLGYLLTNEKGIRYLLRYVHATNRLPTYRDVPPPEPDS